MSIKRREVNIKAKLPQELTFKLQPNDRLIINGIRYIINSNKLNLLTGESSLSLFNDIFEFATPLEVTGTVITPQSILVNHFAQNIEVTVFTNEEFDGIATPDGWITFDVNDYSPNTPFIISLAENATTDNRQGAVTFTFPSGEYVLTIGQLNPDAIEDV